MNWERDLRRGVLGLMGATVAADDQARSMTDGELGERLLTGRWTTIEVHEAGRRLTQASAGRSSGEAETPDGERGG